MVLSVIAVVVSSGVVYEACIISKRKITRKIQRHHASKTSDDRTIVVVEVKRMTVYDVTWLLSSQAVAEKVG